MASAAAGLRRDDGRHARHRRHAPAAKAILASALLVLVGACSVIPLPGARPTPIADRPIDLEGACLQTEEDGYREEAYLRVRSNAVLALDWRLQVGRRGSCSFRLADYRQVKRRPHVELLAHDGSGCRLLIWQDPRRITLAHVGCASRCTPGIYDEAWPVMFDPATGRCAHP